FQPLEQSGIAGRIGLERRAVIDVSARYPVACDGNTLNAAIGQFIEKLGIRDLACGASLLRSLEKVEQRDKQNRDSRPQREGSVIWIHVRSIGAPRPASSVAL